MSIPEDEVLTTFHLVRQAKEGDREALGRLFDRYYKRVRKIVALRLGSRLRGVVEQEDILQDTFLGAVKSFDRFERRDTASVINWLSRIAERAILNAAQHFGRQKRGLGRQVPMDPSDTRDEAIQVPDNREYRPETSLPGLDRARIVEACICELPEEYREIIVLRDYVGYSWADVAREHKRPSQDAARMMHAKAVMRLHELVEKRMRPA